MIRKLVYISVPQQEWLARQARILGIREGEIVRRLIDQAREAEEKEKEQRSATK